MQLTVNIPDDFAARFTSGDLPRRVLELLALDEYKSGRLTEPELQRLLGFGTRYKLDTFLKAHGVMIDDYTVEDLRNEVATLERLGF